MTEQEYRQDDRTIGYCPLCGEQVTDVMTDGGGWCPDHGRVWVNWAPPIVCCDSARATGGAYHAPHCEGKGSDATLD